MKWFEAFRRFFKKPQWSARELEASLDRMTSIAQEVDMPKHPIKRKPKGGKGK